MYGSAAAESGYYCSKYSELGTVSPIKFIYYCWWRPQTHSEKLRLRIINFPERVAQHGDPMAVGNSKQLHNQMSYGPANGLKLFRKGCSTNLYNMEKNNSKLAIQAVMENHSKSGFHTVYTVWYCNPP